MPGRDPKRQLTLAREADSLLAEGRELDARLSEMEPDNPERSAAEARLERILARRAEIDEELLELQGITESADVVHLNDRRKDRL